MIFCVIGAANPRIPGAFKDYYDEEIQKTWHEEPIPFDEYKNLDPMVGYIF